MGQMRRPLFLLSMAPMMVWSGQARADQSFDLAGHYYLQGVRETGSELLLMPGGRFQWYLTYGAVDQTADGMWARSGQVVTLTAKSADRSKPLFRPDEQMGWDSSMERQRLDRERDDQIAELDKKCPPPPVAAVSAPPAAMPGDTAPTPLPEPEVAAPPPPGCEYPPEVQVNDDHPDLWEGGIIIGIADPDMGIAPKGVSVTLTWADGHQEIAKTASRGWALFPRRPGVKAGHVLIDPSFAPWGRAAFDFPPMEKGLQAFTMDARQVVPAPFETMALRLEGKDLIPEGLGGGRYVLGGQK